MKFSPAGGRSAGEIATTDQKGGKKGRVRGEAERLKIVKLYKGEESRCERQSVLKEFKQQINTLRLSSGGGGGERGDGWGRVCSTRVHTHSHTDRCR